MNIWLKEGGFHQRYGGLVVEKVRREVDVLKRSGFFNIYYLFLTMAGKKKKQVKEPDVVVPAGDAKIGKGIFDEQCATCHGLDGDGKGAGAPPLGGVVGRKAGETLFSYSKAMKGSGINWTEKHLYAYLANPGKHIPGNKMSFSGIAGETERGHLIAYLSSV